MKQPRKGYTDNLIESMIESEVFNFKYILILE